MSLIELNYVTAVLLAVVVPIFIIKCIEKWNAASNSLRGRWIEKEETTNLFKYIRILIVIYFYKHKSKPPSKTQQEIISRYKRGKTFLGTIIPRSFGFARDFQSIKEIQCSENFANRPVASMMGVMRKGGILQNNGNSWKELRKYTMKTLGQLGLVRKNQMSSILEAEQQDLLDHIQSQISETGNRILITDLFANSVLNIVWSIATGEKFARDDPNYIQLRDNTYILTKLAAVKILAFEFKPFQYLVQMFPKLFGYSHIFDSLKSVNDYFRNTIKLRQEMGEKKFQTQRDFVDCFLREIETHRNTEKANIYCVDQLVALLIDLFQAGMDTTSVTLESAIMMLIKHPHVQKKIQDEIDEVLGINGSPPNLDHREKMPYTAATIMEINRMANIIPFNIRSPKEDCVVGGVQIKRNTYVILHLYEVRMEEAFWGDPKVFRPERFLDQQNNLIQEKVSHVMAFGGGVRACPGEMVAMWTTFVFLTGILQPYNIAKADENEVLEMDNYAQITNSVLPFHFSVTPR